MNHIIDKPMLTVVVPVYNGQHVLGDMLASLLAVNKNTQAMEVIFVNDGSLDDSAEVMESLAKQYSNVRCIHKENGGIASARNLGLQEAYGQYVAFADQDDRFSEGYARYIEKLEMSGADFLLSNYMEERDGKITVTDNIPQDDILTGKALQDLRRAYIGGGTLPYCQGEPIVRPITSIWQGVYRREWLQHNNIKFVQFVDYEDDYFFMIQLFAVATKIQVLREGFYIWRIRAESTSHTNRYLSDFYVKRKKYNAWLLDKAQKCGLTEQELRPFRQKLWRETILFGFINASNAPVQNSEKPSHVRKEMIEIIAGERAKFSRFGRAKGCLKHRLEYWLLMKLLLGEHYELAYYLNSKVFRRTV